MEHFPRARVVFDAFHIMKMAGQALDKVRKDLARQGADLRGGLWALRGNVWTRSGKRQQRRIQLMATYPAPGRAVFLRELLQDALVSGERVQFEGWLAWAERSRLTASRGLARTLKRSNVITTASRPTWKPN